MTYIVVPSPTGSVSISLTDLVPITDGSSPAAGQVGEIVNASQAALTNTGVGATSVWGNVVSLALDPGVWEIQGVARIFENDAPLAQYMRAGISDDPAGATMADFEYIQSAPILTGNPIQLLTPIKRVSISAITTYYLNTFLIYASGSPEHAGILWALRYS